MAISPEFIVNAKAQELLVAYAKSLVAKQKQFSEIRAKMEIIDQAYARYKELDQANLLNTDGVDVVVNAPCGDVFASDDITAPIVVSQVDAMVAYLADIFLSGYPLFPVVSSPKNRKAAEAMETLMDDHAMLGGYPRQLLLMLKDGVKYNLSAIEADWTSIEQFSVLNDFTSDTLSKTDRALKYFTKVKRLDLYNCIWDYAVAPGDLAVEGDYAGYIEMISKTKLKRLLNKLSKEKKALNVNEAFASYEKIANATGTAGNYNQHPQVSKYISPNSSHAGVDWDIYISGEPVSKKKRVNLYDGSNYEKFTFYARILPSDFGIQAPSPNTPQIWKVTVINMSVVIEATRIVSAYDLLPILMGQPLEDGLNYQTQSTAEGSIDFQSAASTLFNIRFAAARRAVSDRALYNPDYIKPSDVNSKAPAPKIPVRMKALNNAGLDAAYKPIPFDMRGTETTISDAMQIVGFSQQLSGINGPQQGQFQKGNKSVQEWNDTIGGSDNRLRLPAMMYEYQVFSHLKQIIALNIFQYGNDAQLVSQKTGEIVDINIAELRSTVMSFRYADGYSPKSKMAAVETLTAGMNMIMNSPALQQSYGMMLPQVFAHMMQLGGVRDLEQYAPQQAQAPVPTNLAGAALVPTDQPAAMQTQEALPPTMPS